MPNSIPQNISEDEILVHYIFDRSFKRKKVERSGIIDKNIFFPNKGGVSLQRYSYCGESKCKALAKAVPGGKYVGFVIFRKSDFQAVKTKHRENRKDFECDIFSTPLDENFEYYPKTLKVTTETPGNPAHADLEYSNPAPVEDERPNTAIRSFSKKLYKVCELLLDRNPEDQEYNDIPFAEAI